MTDPLRALVLGVVQGLTEFIPVSSSGHLVLVPWFVGWPGSGLAFNVALQLGTLLAVLAYFGRQLWEIGWRSVRGVAGRRAEDRPFVRLAAALIIGTIPGVVVGFLLEDVIDRTFHTGEPTSTSLLAIAGGLVVIGAGLLWAERIGGKDRPMEALGMAQALLIGIAQALALMPGVSRSGSTIAAGLLLGMKRPEAARFSFLLSVPITIGAGTLEAVRLAREGGLPSAEWAPFGVGMLSAAGVGYASIWFLLSYLQTHTNRVFALYRVALALLVIALVAVGWRGA